MAPIQNLPALQAVATHHQLVCRTFLEVGDTVGDTWAIVNRRLKAISAPRGNSRVYCSCSVLGIAVVRRLLGVCRKVCDSDTMDAGPWADGIGCLYHCVSLERAPACINTAYTGIQVCARYILN